MLLARCAARAEATSPRGGNGSHAHGYELGRKRRECLIVPAGPPLLDTDISALDEAALRQTLPKRVSIEAIGIGRGAVQEAYERHLLLRQGRKRQGGRRTAEQRDELAAFHSITSSARANSIGGMSSPSALAVLEIDDQLELCWLLNREIGGFGAFENLADIDAHLAISLREAGCVTH